MPYSLPASLPDVELQPRKPPILRADTAGDAPGWAAEQRDASTIGGSTEPHVRDLSWFEHNPLVLHVSLRDLAPEILLASTNVVDDIEHCLKANTSPHLAEQLAGNRDFLLGTLDDVMAGRATVPADQPLIFSPFGLGVLDLAVGKNVYDKVVSSGDLHVIEDFFHELRRYG